MVLGVTGVADMKLSLAAAPAASTNVSCPHVSAAKAAAAAAAAAAACYAAS